ncbi:MAG: hypothetical protein QOF06_2297 [Solirubrobacterales bacterium]|nr:hypothetical protein [Solirubrobacterales bacterium]
MKLNLPSKLPADLISDPILGRRVRRGRNYRSVGWIGILLSVAVLALGRLTTLLPEATALIVGTALVVSVLMVNWTRIWVKESKEPFKYTYSVGEFHPGPDTEATGFSRPSEGPIGWLGADLTEKLGERVSRLSLLDEEDVPDHEGDEDPAPHVHVSGWYGPRRGDGGHWYLEVVPRIRVGGGGAPAKLARTVRFKLTDPRLPQVIARSNRPPPLDAEQYRHFFERVYWSVASEIYAQLRQRVEQKAMLLPPGRLRAAAYLYEADDYATSNTLDAYEAARHLYRKAQETYDRSARKPSATAWRQLMSGLWVDISRDRDRLRRLLAKVIRRFGQREILAARAELGYARMLIAEWSLRFLCGSAPTELYEAPPNVRAAIQRLGKLPPDVPGQQETFFRALVTLALAMNDLGDPTQARRTLDKAQQVFPADAREDAEFLLADANVTGDPLSSLRLLTRAVDLAPTLERARHRRAELLETLWRRRESFERTVADSLDDEYAEVIVIDPGNVSAWANRGYIGWLLSASDPRREEPGRDGRPSWRERAISALEAGRQYKEVRRDAMVAELDWNLTRLRAENGDFAPAYEHYIRAVSAMLAEPRMGFVGYFYRDATKAMVDRYRAYEKRVVNELAAGARECDDDRLVDSVVAFVLNDCGGAYHAYFQRTGNAEARDDALTCFQKAIAINERFVLPKLNLARVMAEMAFDSAFEPWEQAAFLNSALQQLQEALEGEPNWIIPRLELAELEGMLPYMVDDFGVAGDEAPTLAAHTRLQCLLPHKWFQENGQVGARIDGEGAHVESLVKDRRIGWTTEFDEIQVAVLVNWAAILANQAPWKGFLLCEKLREVFYEAHPVLLSRYISAARRSLAKLPERRQQRLAGRIEECQAAMAEAAFTALKADPVHYKTLLEVLPALTKDQCREILSRARHASPSPQVKTVLARSPQV